LAGLVSVGLAVLCWVDLAGLDCASLGSAGLG